MIPLLTTYDFLNKKLREGDFLPETLIVSVSLTKELVEKLDMIKEERGYFSRSEVVRDAIRDLLESFELGKMESSRVLATIIVLSDFKQKTVDHRLTNLRHEFEDVVVENIHRHIGRDYCLDIFIAEGNNERIAKLVGRIRGIRGIHQVKTTFASLLTSS